MGYDLHITRKVDWADEEGPAIPESEWDRIVERDSELARDPDDNSMVNYVRSEGALWWGAARFVRRIRTHLWQ